MRSITIYLQAAALTAVGWLTMAAGFAAAQNSSFLVPAVAGMAAQTTSPAPGQPTQQTRQPMVIDESVPAPQSESPSRAAAVRTPPCIKYDTNRRARRMYACGGSVNLVMVACNPANGCLYEIPLCVPGCCTGEPTVSNRCGLFGRGIVEYCWPCGFSAKVKFREILGDVRVDYDG